MTAPIDVRLLSAADAGLVESAAVGVFDSIPEPALISEFLVDPRHHLAAAIDCGKVVGIVSAVHYVHPDKPTELWINEVSVAPTHQRQGLGRRLLEAMLWHAQKLGCKNAWVLTDNENARALELYASVGGQQTGKNSVLVEFKVPVSPN